MIQASRCGFLFVWIYLPNRSSRRREAEASSMLKPKFPLALRLWKNFEIRSRCRHYLKPQTPSIKYVLTDQLTYSSSDWTRFGSVAFSCPNTNYSQTFGFWITRGFRPFKPCSDHEAWGGLRDIDAHLGAPTLHANEPYGLYSSLAPGYARGSLLFTHLFVNFL